MVKRFDYDYERYVRRGDPLQWSFNRDMYWHGPLLALLIPFMMIGGSIVLIFGG